MYIISVCNENVITCFSQIKPDINKYQVWSKLKKNS